MYSLNMVIGNQPKGLLNKIHLHVMQAYVDAVVGGSRETLDAFVVRYCDWADANEQRQRVVAAVKNALTEMTLQT